eukprot:scaffold1328_cov394-Prasinococcus_capsulatus_cf.AAC.47
MGRRVCGAAWQSARGSCRGVRYLPRTVPTTRGRRVGDEHVVERLLRGRVAAIMAALRHRGVGARRQHHRHGRRRSRAPPGLTKMVARNCEGAEPWQATLWPRRLSLGVHRAGVPSRKMRPAPQDAASVAT